MNTNNDNINMAILDEDERIDSYLKGQMSKEEEEKFFQDLKYNPELKSKAITIARLAKGLKEAGRAQDEEVKKALLASSEKEIKEIVENIAHPKLKRIMPKKIGLWLSVAASIALVFWIGLGYYNYRKTTGLADEYASSFETSLLTRGADSQSETEKKLQGLFDNIKIGEDLSNTIHELSVCWELSTMETYNDYTEYSSEIGYNLAIGYLKDNDKSNCLIVLKKLIDITDEDSAIHMQSKQLYDDIMNL